MRKSYKRYSRFSPPTRRFTRYPTQRTTTMPSRPNRFQHHLTNLLTRVYHRRPTLIAPNPKPIPTEATCNSRGHLTLHTKTGSTALIKPDLIQPYNTIACASYLREIARRMNVTITSSLPTHSKHELLQDLYGKALVTVNRAERAETAGRTVHFRLPAS